MIKEIEVVDPTHPLYGRRFALASLSKSPTGQQYTAKVIYQKDVLVHIDASSTSLCATPQSPSKTKISLEAVSELVDLAGELGIIPKKGDLK